MTKAILISKSFQTDVVDGIYKILIDQPIQEITNEFCKYYEAVSLEDGLEYFALVFEKQFVPAINIFHILKTNEFPHLNKLITYSSVKLSFSQTTHIVAIVEKYDPNNNLGYYIEKNGPLSFDQINKELIPQISELLLQCEKNNINCGNINPYNILIKDGDNFLLREFISSYQGFNQLPSYLAPEISECTNSGRQIIGLSADIYAFGISVFYCLTGKQPWVEYETLYKYNEDRFEHTTFKVLVNKRKIAEYFKVFFKGILHDNAVFRWKIRNIVEWQLGNSPKVTFLERLNENLNQITFRGNNYGTLKSIAYALFWCWDEAAVFIQDEKLLKWIKRQQFVTNNIDDIQALLNNEKQIKNTFLLKGNDRNNKLIKFLLLIDPEGAIRQQGLAFSTISIPTTLHYLLVKNKRVQADLVIKALQERFWKIYPAKPSATDIDYNYEVIFNKVINVYSTTSVIFGIERVMYSLNEYAQCLSPLFVNDYITNTQDLLICLDKGAREFPEKLNIDRHIIAFIAAKLDIQDELEIKILKNFPKFSDHPLMYGLSVLSLVQKADSTIKIPHLCNALTVKIIELFEEYLHNVNLKKEIITTLQETSKTGNLSAIIEVLTDQKLFIDDYNGYYKACREVQNLKKQIELLSYEEKIFENALILGQKLTVLMSYILCLIVTVILII